MTPAANAEETPYIFESRIRVRDYETDSQGIVNNANYLHYLEITRHDFCEARGCTFAQMHRQGYDGVVRRIEIDYISSLTMDDVMLSRLRVERRGARFIFHQHIVNARTLAPVVSATVTIVMLHDGRPSRGHEVAAMLGL